MEFELRPLSLAEILDAAFRLVQTRWRTLVGLSLLAQIPIMLMAMRASWILDPFAEPFEAGEEPSPEMLMELFGTLGGLSIAYLVLYPFVAAAVTAAVGNFYLGRQYGLGEAARAGGRSLLRLVVAFVLFAVAMVLAAGGVMLVAVLVGAPLFALLSSLGSGGTAVGVFGGIVLFAAVFAALLFLGCLGSLLAPVVVLEAEGIFASVRRAIRLGSTSPGRVIGVVLTAGMIVGFPVFGAQAMIGFLPGVGVLVWALFQAAGFAFTTAVAVLLYFDLRCRAENYDLTLLAEQVEAGPGLGSG